MLLQWQHVSWAVSATVGSGSENADDVRSSRSKLFSVCSQHHLIRMSFRTEICRLLQPSRRLSIAFNGLPCLAITVHFHGPLLQVRSLHSDIYVFLRVLNNHILGEVA